ncbi:hypothetical protein GCM10020331_086170 [Ectobacillus funiculus]
MQEQVITEGQSFTVDDWQLTVMSKDSHQIKLVEIKKTNTNGGGSCCIRTGIIASKVMQ